MVFACKTRRKKMSVKKRTKNFIHSFIDFKFHNIIFVVIAIYQFIIVSMFLYFLNHFFLMLAIHLLGTPVPSQYIAWTLRHTPKIFSGGIMSIATFGSN